MKKRFISLTLTLAMVFSLGIVVYGGPGAGIEHEPACPGGSTTESPA